MLYKFTKVKNIMEHNIIKFKKPIKVILHTNEDDNEVVIIGYVNCGYEIILVDENNYHIEMEELIKPHQRFIMDKIKDGVI